jgi:hypothetical protein
MKIQSNSITSYLKRTKNIESKPPNSFKILKILQMEPVLTQGDSKIMISINKRLKL